MDMGHGMQLDVEQDCMSWRKIVQLVAEGYCMGQEKWCWALSKPVFGAGLGRSKLTFKLGLSQFAYFTPEIFTVKKFFFAAAPTLEPLGHQRHTMRCFSF